MARLAHQLVAMETWSRRPEAAAAATTGRRRLQAATDRGLARRPSLNPLSQQAARSLEGRALPASPIAGSELEEAEAHRSSTGPVALVALAAHEVEEVEEEALEQPGALEAAEGRATLRLQSIEHESRQG